MAHGPSHKKFSAHWLFGENSWYQQSGLKEYLTDADSEPSGARKGLFAVDLKLGDQEMTIIYLIGALVIYTIVIK